MVTYPTSGDEPSPGRRYLGAALAGIGVAAAIVIVVMQTGPRAPAFEWGSATGPPPPINLYSLTETTSGIAVLTGVTPGGVALWWSADAVTWTEQPLEDAPSQLATTGDRLVAYRVRSGLVLELSGEEWIPTGGVSFPEEVRSRRASGRASVVGGSDWLIEISLFGNLWWTDDGTDFALAVPDPAWGPGVEQPFTSNCTPPSRSSPDVPPVVMGDMGLLAMVSSNPTEPFGVWPVCEPVVWSSPDGLEWATTSATVGGPGAYVYDLAVQDGRFLAVGGDGLGEAAIWTSEDGVTWDPIDLDLGSADIFSVDGGEIGWAILGKDTETSAPVGWTSADGRCWESIPPVAGGTDVVVTDDYVFVVDRRNFPTMWRGQPTGSTGICR